MHSISGLTRKERLITCGHQNASSFIARYVRGCRKKAKNCALFTRNVCVKFNAGVDRKLIQDRSML